MTESSAPGVWPTFRFRDAAGALDWLVAVIGFIEHAVYRGEAGSGDGDRVVAHAELLWPDGGGIMLGSDTGESWSGAVGGAGTSTAYLSTSDPGPVFERVNAAGWQIIRPLTEQSYGGSEFAFLDPEGNAWSIGTYRGENL